MFHCGGCHSAIIAEIRVIAGSTPHPYKGNIESNQHVSVLKVYPVAVASKLPEHIPDNVLHYYKQSFENLKQKHFDAAAMMARKVLEVSVKTIGADLSGNLFSRIEKLHERGLITSDLREWAHVIRDDGNSAAHEDVPVSESSAKELLDFTEVFLMYVFTMPKMLEAKRQRTQQQRA